MNAAPLLAQFDRLFEAPDAIPRLRQFILELAFCGKLVPPCSNWTNQIVAEIATEVTPGFACAKSHQVENGHVHLRTHNIATNGRLNFDLLVRVDPRKIDGNKANIREGDILFNNTNSQELVGKTCIVDRAYDYAFSNHITRIRVRDDIDPLFVVRYFMLLLRRGFFARLCTRWIGQAGINAASLKQIEVPVPPLAEQRLLVAKVDELTALCDRLEVALREREDLRRLLLEAVLHEMLL